MLPPPSAGSLHPKNILYDEVYDPVTVAWFDELVDSSRLSEILAEARRFDVITNLNLLNELFHELVDACLRRLDAKIDYMLTVLRTHREHVLWEGQMVPEPGTDDDRFRAALSHKVKRNISIGALEIIICLEGARAFCRERLGLGDPVLAGVLRRSENLCTGLAFLHDQQEQHRLSFLTGEDNYLKYPETTFADIIALGRYRIPPEKFLVVGEGDDRRLKFIPDRPHSGPFTSPVRRCPAQRFRSRPDSELVLNDVLWHLVIDIYQLSARPPDTESGYRHSPIFDVDG